MNHITARRKAALYRIALRSSGAERLAALHLRRRRDITDPLFNWREIAKQMVLLEDHLFHRYKQCPDCIKKHLLTIEAFAEEIPSLTVSNGGGPTGTQAAEELAEKARRWLERLLDGEPHAGVGQEIRLVRKGLIPAVSDPRSQAERVAAVVASRQMHQ